ncbi:MAG: hypothetical protein M1817_006801 [Caeruleum heppii]|nr:MAG: hypothetical protein M1817_006801 [Caeruleum heppii]
MGERWDPSRWPLSGDPALSDEPYHAYVKALGEPYATLLNWPGPVLLPGPLTNDQKTSTSNVYLLNIDEQHHITRHDVQLGPYDRQSVRQLQDHLTFDARSVKPHTQVICVQTILPSIIEALGAALDLPPKIFLQHLGSSWTDLWELRQERWSRPTFSQDMTAAISKLPDLGDGLSLSIEFPRYVVRQADVQLVDGALFPPHSMRMGHENAIPQSLHQNKYRWSRADELNVSLAKDEAPRRKLVGAAKTNQRSQETVHHFTIANFTRNGICINLIFFPPCYEGRFDTYFEARTLGTTPMRPRILEPRFSDCRTGGASTTPTSHVEKHAQRRETADMDAFMEQLAIDTGRYPQNVHQAPVLLAYHFSLGQWQDLIDRLEARYTFVVDALGIQDKTWYTHALKRWILSCATCLSDVIHGLSITEASFSHHEEPLLHPSSPSKPSPRPPRPFPTLPDVLLQYQHIQSSLQHILARVDEEIRKTESDLQTEVAHTNIETGRQSINEAKSVKSLTVLAFIWIPISAVSSIFGTNTQELSGDRLPPIWVFFLTATVVTASTVVAALVHRRHGEEIAGAIKQLYKRSRVGFAIRRSQLSLGWAELRRKETGEGAEEGHK